LLQNNEKLALTEKCASLENDNSRLKNEVVSRQTNGSNGDHPHTCSHDEHEESADDLLAADAESLRHLVVSLRKDKTHLVTKLQHMHGTHSPHSHHHHHNEDVQCENHAGTTDKRKPRFKQT